MITSCDYDQQKVKGLLKDINVPEFSEFLNDYHSHFLRYIYYIFISKSQGEYPDEITTEQIMKTLEKTTYQARIKKLLICEAPPSNAINYFYNPQSPWTAAGKPGSGGATYTGAILSAIFPGRSFPTKKAFLIECAREGFLLLDLFPYAINYNNKRQTNTYKTACISAFGFGNSKYGHSVSNTLRHITNGMEKQISIGFALTGLGETITADASSVIGFQNWCSLNGISLHPHGLIDQIRTDTTDVKFPSKYLRVCHRKGLFGPCPILMKSAGF